MEIIEHASGRELLDRAGSLLLRAEAENNLQLGLAERLRTREAAEAAGAFLATIEARGDPVAVALWTPPFKLTVSRAPDGAVALLADHLHSRRVAPPGVLAPSGTAEAFARAWAEPTGIVTRVERQRIYELTEVIPPAAVRGRLRVAVPRDAPLLETWSVAFVREVELEHVEEDRVRAQVPDRIDAGAAFLWDDGRPVSMAVTQGATPNGIRIGGVYTPPEVRGRGYASACVAAVSERMLDSGRRLCFLYTDLANPTSNRIYQAIGYRPVVDVSSITFG